MKLLLSNDTVTCLASCVFIYVQILHFTLYLTFSHCTHLATWIKMSCTQNLCPRAQIHDCCCTWVIKIVLKMKRTGIIQKMIGHKPSEGWWWIHSSSLWPASYSRQQHTAFTQCSILQGFMIYIYKYIFIFVILLSVFLSPNANGTLDSCRESVVTQLVLLATYKTKCEQFKSIFKGLRMLKLPSLAPFVCHWGALTFSEPTSSLSAGQHEPSVAVRL